MAEDYPPCPDCETDLLVGGARGDHDYVCYGCERRWSE